MTAVFTYVVTSYTNPEQTARLLRRMRAGSPGSRLIVSHDRSKPPPSRSMLRQADAELLLTPDPIVWGDITYLRSQLHAITQADLGRSDWVTILTGQDYPIRPLRDYETHLGSSGFDMVLEETDPSDPHTALLLNRYRVRVHKMPYWMDRHRVHQVVKHIPGVELTHEPRGLPPHLHVRRLRTPFTDQLRLYKGNDLVTLSGRAVQKLLQAPPDLLRYYTHTRIPSESYVHTVLRNDPTLANDPQPLHFSRWEASSHPEWLSVDDLPAMVASGSWFARKFRQDDPVLDLVDEIIEPRGGSTEQSHGTKS